MKRMKITAAQFNPKIIYNLKDKLYEIADQYISSGPVSGDWDTETEHEMNAIATAFNISVESAASLMINELGFEPEEFDNIL